MQGDATPLTSPGDEGSRAKKGPRHAAPRKSLLARWQGPAGKAIALAAMPTAVLVGMSLTPRPALAEDKEFPFAPGPCVTRSDEPPESASPDPSDAPEPSGEASGPPGPSPTTSADDGDGDGDVGGDAAAIDGGGGAESGSEGDEPEPGATPSTTDDSVEGLADDPTDADDGDGDVGSAGKGADGVAGLAPGQAPGRNPLDPLGLGEKLGDVIGGLTWQPTRAPTRAPAESPAAPSHRGPVAPADREPVELSDRERSDRKPAAPSDRGPVDREPSAKPEPNPGPSGTASDRSPTGRPSDPSEVGPTGKETGEDSDQAPGQAADPTEKAVRQAADRVGVAVEELDEDIKGLDPVRDESVPDGAKPRFPCPTPDPDALAAAKLEPGLPMLPDEPWVLKSSKLTLSGLEYHGIVEVRTGGGKIKKVLKFTAENVFIRDLHQLVAGPAGTTAHVQARAGSTSTIDDGTVTMYTEELKGVLFNLVPVTFSPEAPPPLDIPFAVFTNVTVTQAGQFGGTLKVPGLHNYFTE
ncbi:hypothetical protein [Streptomyces sp. NPDC020965]|uniref:hypothetical protein n=1 Tax=Streptomyces sp. NPDC020965 TaxID=3365105 RepID=UPI00378C606F